MRFTVNATELSGLSLLTNTVDFYVDPTPRFNFSSGSVDCRKNKFAKNINRTESKTYSGVPIQKYFYTWGSTNIEYGNPVTRNYVIIDVEHSQYASYQAIGVGPFPTYYPENFSWSANFTYTYKDIRYAVAGF